MRSFRAANLAGADAVYAANLVFWQGLMQRIFQKSRCFAAIDEHIFTGRKFYLTVNTLLKEPEMAELCISGTLFITGGFRCGDHYRIWVFFFVKMVSRHGDPCEHADDGNRK